MSSTDEQKENKQPADMEQIPENADTNTENVDNKPVSSDPDQTSIVIALDASEEAELAVKCECEHFGSLLLFNIS